MGKKIKVLIVDDASFMLKAIGDILKTDENIEVVGCAKNGKEALEKIQELKPDVITLDVDMPVMDGLKTVRHIMIESQVPIVMLSSLFNHGEITFEALRLGVVDFLPKPSGAISTDIHEQSHKILDRVKIAADENISNVRRVRLCEMNTRDRLSERYEFRPLEYLIVVGTTLGGPNTIINIMSKLSPELPAAVVVVQEISSKILPAFVERFNDYSPWKIEVAKENTKLEQGVCYISSYETPLVVNNSSDGVPYLMAGDNVSEPLNDLFESAAVIFGEYACGVLLTGVGSDGTKGFSAIKQASGITIAQATDTCVYPNLTDSAIKSGVVDYIESSNNIAEKIEAVMLQKRDS